MQLIAPIHIPQRYIITSPLEYQVPPAGISGISATINGNATVAGTLVGAGTLIASVAGHATVTVSAIGSGELAASISGKATVSGTLSGPGAASASINGHALVTGTLAGAGNLASSVSGLASVSGLLVSTGKLSSSVSGHASVSGLLVSTGKLSSAISGHATVGGTLIGAGSALSSILGHATVSLIVQTISEIQSSIVGHATVSASPTIAPPTFVSFQEPGTTGYPILFGVSESNPSEVTKFSSSAQPFFKPGNAAPSFYPDSNLGNIAMPGQLLIKPSSQRNAVYWVVLGGDAFVPAGTISASLVITLNQNVFSQAASSVQTQTFAMASTNVQVVSGQTVLWRLVFGPVYNWRVWGDGQSSPLSLSASAQLNGSSSSLPLVRLMQFELQS